MTGPALLAAYLLLVLAMAALETWARRRRRRSLTLAGAVGAILATHGGRWLLLLGWAWLGWHLFVRSTP